MALVHHSAPLTFGGQTLNGGPGTSMIVLEANGAERLGVRIADEGAINSLAFELDPMGRAYVITSADCSGSQVSKYDLNGSREWSLMVPGAACSNSEQLKGFAISNHHLVISGQFTVPTDFGTGVITPIGNAPNGFLLKLNR